MQLVAFEHSERVGEHTSRPGSSSGSMNTAVLGFEALEAVRHGTRRLGAIVPSGPHEGAVIDLNRALAVKLASEDGGAPECEADSLLPSDPQVFVRRFSTAVDAARATLAFVADALERYDAPDLASAGIVLERRDVRLASPIARPGKLVGVVPDPQDPARPRLFLKASSAVAGPVDELALHPDRSLVVSHGELAVVIGRRTRCVRADDALGHVAGYCAALSIRAVDETDALAWSGDGFAPLGPALVTADAVPEPHDLGLRTRVSGVPLQTTHTKTLAWKIPDLIARASAAMTLEPGDVVLSGAPGPHTESRPLHDGDLIEIEVERVGRMALYVRGSRS